jgi:hypothetical protein
MQDRDELHEKYESLSKRSDRFVGEYNAIIAPKNIGRPVAASAAQIANVHKLRKGGMSLHNITDEVNLGLQTIRTITEKAAGSDRASMKRLERIDPAKVKAWRGRKRSRDGLPKKIEKFLEDADKLIKDAKGLGG